MNYQSCVNYCTASIIIASYLVVFSQLLWKLFVAHSDIGSNDETPEEAMDTSNNRKLVMGVTEAHGGKAYWEGLEALMRNFQPPPFYLKQNTGLF